MHHTHTHTHTHEHTAVISGVARKSTNCTAVSCVLKCALIKFQTYDFKVGTSPTSTSCKGAVLQRPSLRKMLNNAFKGS